MKLDKVPPVTVMSLATKSVEASDRVNVIVAVSPAFRLVLLLVIAIVGGVVSQEVFKLQSERDKISPPLLLVVFTLRVVYVASFTVLITP